MKRAFPIALIVALFGPGLAQEHREEPVLHTGVARERVEPARAPAAPEEKPWLGITISKPATAIYAQIREVPRGAGFFVDQVEPGSPAMAAGVARYDLLWKFDDQLLINEAQLMALLALKEPGDRARLTCFRSGENLELEVTVQTKPRVDQREEDLQHILSTGRVPGMPWQMVNIRERVALVEDSAGVVKLSRRGGAFVWEELSLEGDLKSRGVLQRGPADGSLVFPEDTDPALRRKLAALVRAYEQASERARGGNRLPRVRRIPEGG